MNVRPVDILIITAADGEDDAVRAVDDGALGDWIEEHLDGHPFAIWRRSYRSASGRSLHVVLSRAGQMGGEAAASAASGLVKLLKPRCLAMCGVCAGRPGWTNLGDVIVADRVYRYDTGEEVVIDGVRSFKSDVTTYNLDARWKQKAERYDVETHRAALAARPKLLEEQERWLVAELCDGRDPLKSTERTTQCPDWPEVVDRLRARKLIAKQSLAATKKGRQFVTDHRIRHPDGAPVLGLPKIHVGPLGTGNNLQRDDDIFDRLSVGQRLIRGLDMEASAIGLAGHFEDVEYAIVAKGVMDFAEPGRNYRYRAYAARAAAEVLLGFLRQNLESFGRSAADVLSAGTLDLPTNPSPAQLLTARYQAVPWNDEVRQAELAELTAWCGDSAPVSIRLFTGPGGSGKTRLFVEWSQRLRSQGWDAGFIAESLVDRDSTDHADMGLLLSNDRPTFVVVDYAESRMALSAFLKRVVSASRGNLHPLRVALVAREVADWYRLLLQQDDALRDCLERHAPLRLANVPVEGALRAVVVREAAAQFAELRSKSAPAVDTAALAAPRFNRLLYLHMAALAAVDGLTLTADQLLDGIVTHETRFWGRTFAGTQGRTDQQRVAFVQAARRTVAALTLRGGAPSVDVAECVNQAAKGPSDDAFVSFLRSLYPGSGKAEAPDSYLRWLEPDLLGEALVHSVLTDANTSSGFLARVCADASLEALSAAFTVLGRLAWRHERDARPWVRQLLEADVTNRAVPALRAALSLGEESAFAPVGEVLAGVLQTQGTSEIAAHCEPLLPEQTVSLRELAAWVSETLLSALDPQGPDDGQIERARHLNNLSVRLSALGRGEAALTATEEAVELYRRLASTRPDAFLPDLAMSLNNLGNRLSELGRREAALTATEEAVEIRRRLASSHPDAFVPDLAMSLNNLGNMLSELGRREAALTATDEAVEIYRRLASTRPDAFSPDLATSLNNLGIRMSELRRREAALTATEEAVETYRRLASTRPDAFLPYLATSLNNLGAMLSELGRREAALTATEEAVETYRRLASTRPDAFLPYLATSLNNLGAILSELGRREAALTATEEAVEICRRLASTRPDAFLPYLAASLNNLGAMLSALGRREAALTATEEAVEIRRRLASTRPEAFLPDLAMGLNNLGNRLSELGRREAALEPLREAARYYLGFARNYPEAFLNNLLIVLRDLVENVEATGQDVESNEVVIDAAQFLQSLQANGGAESQPTGE